MLTTADGAKTSLYCATSEEVSGQSGLYYDECQVAEPNPLALDAALAKQLWEKSERWSQN
jgi:hypothetical protein